MDIYQIVNLLTILSRAAILSKHLFIYIYA